MSFLVKHKHAMVPCCSNFGLSTSVANIVYLVNCVAVNTPNLVPTNPMIRQDRKGFQIWRNYLSLFIIAREVSINDLSNRGQACDTLLTNQNGGFTCDARSHPKDVAAQRGIGHHFHEPFEDPIAHARVAALTAPDGLIDFI